MSRSALAIPEAPQPGPALELHGRLVDDEGRELEVVTLPTYVDQRGKRWALASDLAKWVGYSHGGQVRRLAGRYPIDFSGLRTRVTVTRVGKRRRVDAFSELGWYVLVQLAHTHRGRALRRFFAHWLMDQEPARRSVETPGEALAAAHAILRASTRSLKALAEAEERPGKPLLTGPAAEVMADVIGLSREPRRLIEVAVGGVAQVAMAHRRPLRRDDE